ncbi:hypothetical protein FRC06_007256, partial [Ceratobasidium sp. 370]
MSKRFTKRIRQVSFKPAPEHQPSEPLSSVPLRPLKRPRTDGNGLTVHSVTPARPAVAARSTPLFTFTADLQSTLPQPSTKPLPRQHLAGPAPAAFMEAELDDIAYTPNHMDDESELDFVHVPRRGKLFANEAKLSAQRFYNVLVAQTSPLFPDSVPNRYREFLRVTRQWQHLQDLKRAGSQDLTHRNSPAGDLAIRCPACPIPHLNFQPGDVTDTD